MPAHQNPMPIRHLAGDRACPFGWCTRDHFDDWTNDENGDAYRCHTGDLPRAGHTVDAVQGAYLVVDEVRTTTGARFTQALVQVNGRVRVPVDEFADDLTALLAHLPLWRDAALEVENLRASLCSWGVDQ